MSRDRIAREFGIPVGVIAQYECSREWQALCRQAIKTSQQIFNELSKCVIKPST